MLTDVELEFMVALWEIGKGSVRDVMAAVTGETKRAYTSVATVLKILEDKGYARSERQDRSLIYSPVVQRADYEGRSLKNLSDSLFGGTPTALVARLVDNEDLTDEMIQEIKEIIDTRIRKDDG
ncbi:BlaI/MecI/CopY family transcriptional regulator [Cognatishimia sp. SS12]|uniref:BlaI/MecI/CopY family transcriptional regulator n=1 Tax=Cognatishimia sp. SS12 TaxID=2979465 RepID=UPI00232B7C05|nr:BlaI/MecI/CopY family transcriptional regulator [Cognatishimia sp. SS12]MDC0738665.1 BlaI/MecI/CopY family transcriptional regulator [Cognatishimia sp. SS12]